MIEIISTQPPGFNDPDFQHPDFQPPNFERRFGGISRLYGDAGLAKLQAAHMVIIGIGGVGSWAAEALARNAVGTITLVDLDNIAESNFNRQLHAVDGNIGKPKVTAMRERILSINPACKVAEIEDFITPENVAAILHFKPDCVLDCTDDVAAKVSLAAFCRAKKIPLIISGGAGGKLEVTRIQIADLAHAQGDKLLAKMRNQLRKMHGFAAGRDTLKKSPKFGLACVYSDEPARKPAAACETNTAITGLNCAGYGSSVNVTASFGFAMAQWALNLVTA